MIAAQRDELMQVLSEVSSLCPGMRMGQLIVNLATLARGPAQESAWEVEDDELLAAAKKQRDWLTQGRS
ncbi:MAG: hypothetical protein SFU86_10065 [Pirellulaceae bacterium]|nr:hypothetical protein [Pirellulaceae bacterium]